VDRTVSVPGPELKALLQRKQPMLISELMAHHDQRRETRRFRYGHLLGPGLSAPAIADWQEQHNGDYYLLLHTAERRFSCFDFSRHRIPLHRGVC
jgi:hypothetical protein